MLVEDIPYLEKLSMLEAKNFIKNINVYNHEVFVALKQRSETIIKLLSNKDDNGNYILKKSARRAFINKNIRISFAILKYKSLNPFCDNIFPWIMAIAEKDLNQLTYMKLYNIALAHMLGWMKTYNIKGDNVLILKSFTKELRIKYAINKNFQQLNKYLYDSHLMLINYLITKINKIDKEHSIKFYNAHLELKAKADEFKYKCSLDVTKISNLKNISYWFSKTLQKTIDKEQFKNIKEKALKLQQEDLYSYKDGRII